MDVVVVTKHVLMLPSLLLPKQTPWNATASPASMALLRCVLLVWSIKGLFFFKKWRSGKSKHHGQHHITENAVKKTDVPAPSPVSTAPQIQLATPRTPPLQLKASQAPIPEQ